MDLASMTEGQAIQKMQSYLFQLSEQLQYMMSNIDEENTSGSQTEAAITQEDVKKIVSDYLKNNEIDLSGNETIQQMKSTLEEHTAAINDLKKTVEQKVFKSTYYEGVRKLQAQIDAIIAIIVPGGE